MNNENALSTDDTAAALAAVEAEAIARATFDEKVEQAIREELAKTGDTTLQKLVAELDARRAAGEHVILRIDVEAQKINVIKFEEVSVSLSQLVEDAEEALAEEADE
jgi:hypothetical protein